MKKALTFILCMTMIALPVLGSLSLPSFADGSHGTYMDVDTSPSGGKSKAFMIDFYSDSEDAVSTYWNNAGFAMYTGASVKKLGYKNITGGGGYGGLQITTSPEARTGIMSIWRYEYLDSKGKTQYVYADTMYPSSGTHFGNEGSGTSFIDPFPWKSHQWYRQLLYSWDDEETGMTFAGMWFYDYVTDEWTLLCYYNTKLVDSYFTGGFGQFLENYNEGNREKFRQQSYRNTYVQSYTTGKWISAPSVHLFSDGNAKAVGEVHMGISADGSTVWASVDGASKIDSDTREHIYTNLVQPATPTYGTPALDSLKVYRRGGDMQVFWDVANNSTPQLAYKAVFTDKAGRIISQTSGTRPEVRDCIVPDVDTDCYKCTLTVTDVFGQSVSAEYKSNNFDDPSLPAIIPTLVTADLPAGVSLVPAAGDFTGNAGADFSFSLKPDPGYTFSDALQVSVFGKRILPSANGTYNFKLSRDADNAVTVKGVVPSYRGTLNILGYNGTSNNFENFADQFVCILAIDNGTLPKDLYDGNVLASGKYPYTFRLTVNGEVYDVVPSSFYNFETSSLYRLPVSDCGWFPSAGSVYNAKVEICENGVPIYRDNSVSLTCRLDGFSDVATRHVHNYNGKTVTVTESTCSTAGKAYTCCSVAGCSAIKEITLPLDGNVHTYNGTGTVTKNATALLPGEKSCVCTSCRKTVTSYFFPRRCDTNGDDAVTIGDVTALLDHLKDHDTTAAFFDNNGDGLLTIKDVTCLLLVLGGNTEV